MEVLIHGKSSSSKNPRKFRPNLLRRVLRKVFRRVVGCWWIWKKHLVNLRVAFSTPWSEKEWPVDAYFLDLFGGMGWSHYRNWMDILDGIDFRIKPLEQSPYRCWWQDEKDVSCACRWVSQGVSQLHHRLKRIRLIPDKSHWTYGLRALANLGKLLIVQRDQKKKQLYSEYPGILGMNFASPVDSNSGFWQHMAKRCSTRSKYIMISSELERIL